MNKTATDAETVIIGAGPAGLTAAYELTKHGRPCVVLEADPSLVGGISRTCRYQGYRFDIGGHRFFSKNEEVNRIWREVLGDQLITRSRMSRILFDRKLFDYPLRPVDALGKLGLRRSISIAASYMRARLRPIRPEQSFEDWVVNRFGRQLFEIFFKTYTEKVWGIPTSEISADWAAQRIKGLDLKKAVVSALVNRRAGSDGEVVRTLVDRFLYPRLGPGQMWEEVRDRICDSCGAVVMDRRVDRILHDGREVSAVVARDGQSRQFHYRGRDLVSPLPIRSLVRALDPAPPPEIVDAANALRYRDFLTVFLIVDQEHVFPDTWIYIHEPSVRLGRVQNFKNWSPDMVPDPTKTSLGLEYFCFEGDDLWARSDADLIALGRKEIEATGLVHPGKVIDGCVVRMPKAYPVYDDDYLAHLRTIRKWLDKLGNLHLAGRNGMHKYNNQDHSMMTALLVARKVLGISDLDPWNVNTDAEYHEDPGAETGRRMPHRKISIRGRGG